MDFAYFKFLKYINKNNKINWFELCNIFNISKTEAKEIVHTLYEKGYVYRIGDTGYSSTYKGKHYIKSAIFSFINVNIIDILALIVSIIALIVAMFFK